MLVLQMREHQVGYIIQDICLIIEFNRQNGMSNISDRIFQEDNAHVVNCETKFALRVIFGDAVIFANSGKREEFTGRCPVVSDTLDLAIKTLGPVVESGRQQTGNDRQAAQHRRLIIDPFWRYKIASPPPLDLLFCRVQRPALTA